MSYVEYEKAQKLGLKAFKNAVSKGENEYLPVLDEILEGVDIVGEMSLGIVQIPLDRIVGTSNVGRTYAFANNFMPLLDYKTEFGAGRHCVTARSKREFVIRSRFTNI